MHQGDLGSDERLALQRRIEEMQSQLDAAQASSRRQHADLERHNRGLWEENAKLRREMHKQPYGAAPSPGVVPAQPQQPVSVSVGFPGMPPQPPSPSPRTARLPPPYAESPMLPPAAAPFVQVGDPMASEDSGLRRSLSLTNGGSDVDQKLLQVQQELAEKSELLEKYRAKTRHLNLGIEAPTTPASRAAARGRGRMSSGPARSLIVDSDDDRDARSTVDCGVQVGVEFDSVPTQTEPCGDVSVSRQPGSELLSSSAVLETLAQLPSTRPLRVTLFTQGVPASRRDTDAYGKPEASDIVLNGSNSLPPAMNRSWADEPAEIQTASTSLPARLDTSKVGSFRERRSKSESPEPDGTPAGSPKSAKWVGPRSRARQP